jgi:AcrR family transcriptional regulator
MPKLSEQKLEQRRRAIQRAALRCFLKLGYNGTSVRDIAAAAKVSLGAVYGYFPDKTSLYTAVIESSSRDFLTSDSGLRRYLSRSRFPDDLEDLADALAEDVDRFRDYFKLIYLDVVEFEGEHIKQVFSDLETKFGAVLGEHFRRIGKLGRKRRVDPALAFVATYLALYQYFLLTRLFGARRIFGSRSDKQVVADLIAFFQDGMAK